jgi:hypothetical protein
MTTISSRTGILGEAASIVVCANAMAETEELKMASKAMAEVFTTIPV